jgi:isopropylmalate/homocitrate/citramalate synthase
MLDITRPEGAIYDFLRFYYQLRVGCGPDAESIGAAANGGRGMSVVLDAMESMPDAKALDMAGRLFWKVYLKLPAGMKPDEITRRVALAGKTASGIVLCDRNSEMEPFGVLDTVASLRHSTRLELEFSAGNAHGLAGANSLSALRAGVGRIHVSACPSSAGDGAPAEEVIMCAAYFLDAGNTGFPHLSQDFTWLSEAAGTSVPLDKALIGKDIFAHESGIHVDGVLKDPALYEAFLPQDVGLERWLVVGKHSGRKAIANKFLQFGIELDVDGAQKLLAASKETAQRLGRALYDSELKALYEREFGPAARMIKARGLF